MTGSRSIWVQQFVPTFILYNAKEMKGLLLLLVPLSIAANTADDLNIQDSNLDKDDTYFKGVKPIPAANGVISEDEEDSKETEYVAGVLPIPISNEVLHEIDNPVPPPKKSKREYKEYVAGVEAIPVSDEVVFENENSGAEVTQFTNSDKLKSPEQIKGAVPTITEFVVGAEGESNGSDDEDDDDAAEYTAPDQFHGAEQPTDTETPEKRDNYLKYHTEQVEPSDSLNLRASLFALGGAILALII